MGVLKLRNRIAWGGRDEEKMGYKEIRKERKTSLTVLCIFSWILVWPPQMCVPV